MRAQWMDLASLIGFLVWSSAALTAQGDPSSRSCVLCPSASPCFVQPLERCPPCVGGTHGLAQIELHALALPAGASAPESAPPRCAANATGFDPVGGAPVLLGRTDFAPARAPAESALPGPWQQQQGASKALWPGSAPGARLPVLSGGCAGRFVAPPARHVDPFGMQQLLDLWPKDSKSRVRPRPWPLGPAYNSSEFNVFINTTYVVLVRIQHLCRLWSHSNAG